MVIAWSKQNILTRIDFLRDSIFESNLSTVTFFMPLNHKLIPKLYNKQEKIFDQEKGGGHLTCQIKYELQLALQ